MQYFFYLIKKSVLPYVYILGMRIVSHVNRFPPQEVRLLQVSTVDDSPNLSEKS